MNLFHHKHHGDPARPSEADSFEVVGDDGTIVRYRREDFAELFETEDASEVQQQVERGWLILDERSVLEGARGPSPEFDLLPGIEGMRADGFFGYEQGEEHTVYTVGYLKEGAVGTPEE